MNALGKRRKLWIVGEPLTTKVTYLVHIYQGMLKNFYFLSFIFYLFDK